jgi:hypothetical protein
MHIFDKTITSHAIRFMAHQGEYSHWSIWQGNGFGKLFETSLNINHYSQKMIKRLKRTGVPLTRHQSQIRIDVITKRSMDMDLVLDVIATWVLAESYNDYRQEEVLNLNPVEIELALFYEAVTHDNVFLVVEFLDNYDTIKAVEVNPYNQTICGVVIIYRKQLITSYCGYNKYIKPFHELIF